MRYSAPHARVRLNTPYAIPTGQRPMTPDPDRKPTKQEMRQGGMVAAAVLLFLALFTVLFVVIA